MPIKKVTKSQIKGAINEINSVGSFELGLPKKKKKKKSN